MTEAAPSTDKPPAYRYAVKILRVVDDDTLEATVDLGFCVSLTAKLRLRGINCPELNTPEGKAAKAFVVQEVAGRRGLPVTADTVKVDKYGGRWDAVVYLNGVSLGQLLLDAGHAVPFTAKAGGRGG